MRWEIQINHKIHFITKQPLRERPTLILTLSKKGFDNFTYNLFHLSYNVNIKPVVPIIWSIYKLIICVQKLKLPAKLITKSCRLSNSA